jgi:hypothetical protein
MTGAWGEKREFLIGSVISLAVALIAAALLVVISMRIEKVARKGILR